MVLGAQDRVRRGPSGDSGSFLRDDTNCWSGVRSPEVHGCRRRPLHRHPPQQAPDAPSGVSPPTLNKARYIQHASEEVQTQIPASCKTAPGTRTASGADRIGRAGPPELATKPHRSARMRLRRLTAPRRGPVKTDPAAPRRITRLSHRHHQLDASPRTRRP
ncbi:hypothetical protein SHO565_76790 [Streptomyces sp. HO565]